MSSLDSVQWNPQALSYLKAQRGSNALPGKDVSLNFNWTLIIIAVITIESRSQPFVNLNRMEST
jgi:hypothetical protein